jgi:hypothetical protein
MRGIETSVMGQPIGGKQRTRQRAICTTCEWAGPIRSLTPLGKRLAAHDLSAHNLEHHRKETT